MIWGCFCRHLERLDVGVVIKTEKPEEVVVVVVVVFRSQGVSKLRMRKCGNRSEAERVDLSMSSSWLQSSGSVFFSKPLR